MMKVTLLIATFFLLALASQAQWSQSDLSVQKHYLYSTGEYVVGKEQAGKIGLNYTYNNKYTISIGYSATLKKTMTPTDDFLKSASNLAPAYSTEPFENNENLHLMLGRIIPLDKQNSIRLVLQGGPGISTFRSPEFSLLTSGDRYDYNIATKKKLSLVVNPKLEMPLLSALGCSIGPMLIVNDEQKYFGASIGIMYGIIKN
nr:hypothetical protein [uncultured Draconibacterium sp.]